MLCVCATGSLITGSKNTSNYIRISATFKHDAMRWSPRLEDACRILSAAERSEADKLLVVLVRSSRILLEASEIALQSSDDPMLCMQASLAIRPLKSSLDLLKGSLTESQLRHGKYVRLRRYAMY